MDLQSIDALRNDSYYIGLIDGKLCRDKKSFLIDIAKAFQFPDYYGNNLDAFWDCINDLEWLVEPNYALIIKNSDFFLSKCSQSDKNQIIELLNDVPKEWSKEHEFSDKADFKIIYD